MLDAINAESMNTLLQETIPEGIRNKEKLRLPEALTEHEFLNHFRKLASENNIFRSFIGQGYYNCITPEVIKRNILENPGWYTAYTPYQAEIAQGRLEALINFQTVVTDLTGMEIANASLLDEGTAAAEAMTLSYSLRKGKKKNAHKFLVAADTHPQTIDVLRTKATPLGIELVVEDPEHIDFTSESLFGSTIFGALLQYPGTYGQINDYKELINKAHDHQIIVTVASDLLSLTLIEAPGKQGADIVVGSSQRFGVPMGYGGPHAAFFATRESYKRHIPGRIIGASVDRQGRTAFRMALQTREQHIRRERATSNICTAQVLLAVMAGMYAVYHGPEGLRRIANRVHTITSTLALALEKIGYKQHNTAFFDTLHLSVPDDSLLRSIAENHEVNLRYPGNNTVCIAIDETFSEEDFHTILKIFSKAGNTTPQNDNKYDAAPSAIPASLQRKSPFMENHVFNAYQSEHELLRYMKLLENKDLSLTHSMISLGSCTMKLNATAEMAPVTWPEIANLHPFAPKSQASGYTEIIERLSQWLAEITGFEAISFQPNSGAQGEYAGLLAIRSYHLERNDKHRDIALIPSSAHGTNPASAVMAGMKVVIVKCDENGNIDIDDLRDKAEKHHNSLAALMVTYPSTHGVFEEGIKEICNIIHEHGGQVYMDGANMNAQVGLTSPALIGADVCHLNLHKTFCIPHGGGGPGVGPIGVARHLVPFLPGHRQLTDTAQENIVSAAPWGSASILPISYAYIALMGPEGLEAATTTAILNANYLMYRIKEHYPILYTAQTGRCAHEFILDLRSFKSSCGIEVEDIAKRLMDYGFHAPTVSFPVPGTMMIEPTESESKAELDRFCDALIAIRKEIEEIESGKADATDNVLKNAPHTIEEISASEWTHPYSREKAAFPLDVLRSRKFWPSVSRVDNAYGDRNLICTCAPIEAYME